MKGVSGWNRKSVSKEQSNKQVLDFVEAKRRTGN
jgi:hypothetical protein